ncbi:MULTISPECIES: beta-ketoacyl synthase N-terminal-like domain-containing protein [unclassified Okeania]|uniref:type I polyketide synthase n=1 Tax=unclassified Okeania TaxID=2634635 RepID=UPI0013B98C73|nr:MULTISPECIES: beta-ketoacyl synthase N-terminal-like domain-containing protein [unclassified Okeania]NES77487.1 acyltransferase domain-containing protein [Okeania sp. SIO1H4]NET21167.1 acyltransferase domain-containing protein [Okeania sp. SIO1H5]NET94260.1 acyltransferase domain-containing protein [Okeania sp. SIO1H2]
MNREQQGAFTNIAIIGMACRFPGANDYKQFWQNLELGVNSISEVPSQRWEVDKYYSATPEQPNKSISKWGGLIEGVDQFDTHFFGISPREATSLDPQQRMMLELSWSCMEDAGYSPSQLSGKNVGVFIGACSYDSILLMNKNEESIEGHSGTGTWTCMIPNRISSYFNFHGPSIPIDTACSSSLVAIHYAVSSLQQLECETALVGGISVLFTSTTYIQMSQLGMLSPTGQCKTFDSSADGYVRGEGAGVILLKPLEKAIEDGDRIYGVIKGSAINHGGRARTLTSPNVYAQAQVLRSAYTKAKIPPNTVSYIEAHGTGTPLGDPIEINALKRGFKQLHQQYGLGKSKKSYCGLGAVKSNIGHLEGAAGIAGVIKVLLAMKHKKLPTIVNFKELNPRINLKDSPFYIIDKTQEWKKLRTKSGEEIPRRAGVSSFGIGGVNAHTIIEEAPVQVRTRNDRVAPLSDADNLERSIDLLTLSAKTEKALQDLVVSYQNHLENHPELEIADICYTANIGREQFDYRLAAIASNREELVTKLQKYRLSEEVSSLFSGELSDDVAVPKIAFLFTGQGAQYVDMGRQLYEQAPVFREAIDKCDEILGKLDKTSLKEILYPANKDDYDSSLLNQTAYTQPTLFAVEYALYKLWDSWGVKPDAVMGHSVGEYVAACVAGIFSLEDGLKLIAARGSLMQQLPSGGEMVSVMASESDVREAIASVPEISIAAINGPESIVISGESVAVNSVVNSLERSGIKTKQLQVSHAFHSQLMEPMLAEFEEVANQITYNNPQITIISNLTGTTADNSIASAKYWVDHIRQPVRFAQGMEALQQEGSEILLEIGPKPILLGMGRECLMGSKKLWLPSLRPGKQDWLQMLQSLSEFYIRGIKVDWLEFYRDYSDQKVELPTYPWQRKSYWIKNIPNNKVSKSLSEPQLLKTQTQTNRQRGQKVKIELLNLDSMSVAKSSSTSFVKQQKNTEILDLQQKNTEISNFQSLVTRDNLDFNEIKETLKQKLANAMYVEPSEIIENKKFIDLGLDSIVGVEWINSINKHYGLDIKVTQVYNYPTVLELTRYITQELSNQKKVPVEAPKIFLKTEASESNAQVNFLDIKETLKQKLANAMYVEPREIIENKKFIDLGLDSIVGVEWINSINKHYGLDIKVTQVYNYPTLFKLAEYIKQEIDYQNLTAAPIKQELPRNQVDDSLTKNMDFSSELQDSLMQELDSILEWVAQKELSTKVANQMIEKLKQKARAN